MLAGRDRELTELTAGLSRIAAGGAFYLFTGEPGIGKTRLAAELVELARGRGVRASWGRCWEAGGAPPFWPWREALEGCGLAFPDATKLATSDPAEARFGLFREVASLLAKDAAREPLLIVLEDLHAADQPTLLLLEFVAAHLREAPIVVVGTYREVEARLRPDAGDAFARLQRSGTAFRLLALSEAEVAAVLNDAIEGADSRLAATIYEITHGNPLFVEEMVRDVRARGLGSGVSIPLGVREIIRQRLGRVSEQVRPVLDAAAVLGVESAVTVLGRLTADVEAVLDDAARSGLVTARAGRVRFCHSLYREGLYHDLPRLRRQALHREAARALADSGASLAELAHHLLESGPDVAADAIDHAVRAAAQAVDVFAFEEAAALLERAVGAVPTGPLEKPLRCRVLIAQGEARVRSGDATGRELCAQAAAIARELGDAALLSRAGLAYGSVFLTGGVDPFLVGMLEEALSGMADVDTPLRARVMARLAAARQPSAPEIRQRDVDLAHEAIALARRVADRRELLAVLHAASGVLYGAADPTIRLPITRELERLAEELGDTARLLHARVRLAIDYLELADFASYEALASSYEALAERIGPAAEPWRVPLMRSMLAIREDRFDDSLRWQEESRRMDSERPRPRRAQAFHHICFLRAAERHGELRASIPELRNLWLAMPYGVMLAEARVASLLARIGADDELCELLGRLPEQVFREEINAASLAEAVWATGDAERAKQLYPLIREKRWNMYWFDCEIVEAPALRLLAYLAGVAGEWNECDRLYERALRAVEAVGLGSMAARMRFELGDLFVRSGREPERARELLTDARGRASGLGLVELVALIDRRHPSLAPSVSPSGRPSAVSMARTFSMVAEGEYFAISTARGTLRFKASRGMHYLARLVEQPDVAVHALELAGSSDHPDRGDAGELLDSDAFRAYRARLQVLRGALEEAEARGDVDRAERARDEMETIAGELARGSGRGGRARRAESAVDRARSAVQRRIKDAIRRIAEQDGELGAWLQRSVTTGNYCIFGRASESGTPFRGLSRLGAMSLETALRQPNAADIYERNNVPACFERYARDLVERARPIGASERILDLGCGTGIVARVLRERLGGAAKIVGLDASRPMLEKARSIAPEIDFREGNAMALPFEDGSFDLVLSQEMLQFVPDRVAALREVRRVLSPGGRLLASTWRPRSVQPFHDALGRVAERHLGTSNDKRWSLDGPALGNALAEAGFIEVRVETVSLTERFREFSTRMNALAANFELSALSEAEKERRLAAVEADSVAEVFARFALDEGFGANTIANVATAISPK